ncbi:CRISPR-associated helicase Cas3' [Paucibacter sp. PLA-PC-4]|uniref:CRISPR-associated helicase Cas3' n=1 Tax=Paucibacter sp. PLA-PC-4 TaxID=2993655 RepID=UPI00224B1744|nr:CRISPR-associated helicase Cas3' [Paucibacter sp. PLA-PC-4]MCX2865659.1 CRISPR-associated helicase Cas3' [Paucibacter sp. PLA-PC-4]
MDTLPPSLRLPYFRYWGKARPSAAGPRWHLLAYHCLDVAAVGQVYLLQAPGMLNWLKEQLAVDDEDALVSWLVFWLALHDLGKFSLSFQAQRADLMGELQGAVPTHSQTGVRHDSLGMQCWSEHILPLAEGEGWFGIDSDIDEGLASWARAVTGHHGQPPLNSVPHLQRHFRQQDTEAAKLFATEARQLLLTPDAASLPSRSGTRFEKVSRELSWWVAGLAVLADWIGSNSEIFSYRDQADEDMGSYWPHALTMARRALRESGTLPSMNQGVLGFQALFPRIQQPSPLQSWAIDVPLLPGPQIHLLEDVTGAGKTEAAVMLAYRLMTDCGAEGFFIGLPTMATANAMYSRIADIYARLFADPRASLVLAHGGRHLVEEFAASVIAPGCDEGDARQQDESATRRCQRWLADHNKRALLSPAGIGTVDQALLGALQSKHQSLRLLGLARKVLIIDEVHACDHYMQRTLETLLQFHARAGGSAILLSATLTLRMKAALLRAFARGCGQAVLAPQALQYPLASSWSSADPDSLAEAAIATRRDVRRCVHVRYESERSAVLKGIVEALSAGRCVAWIRNTVADALEAQADMAALWPAERITLFHARFALGDRLDTEQKVLSLFGRDSRPEQRSGQLLIATQVAEQSLDVDLDLVVSDLAPIDRLIQRAGRLRRHVRDALGARLLEAGATDQRGEPWLWVLGPAWSEEPPADWFKKAFPKVARVYEHHGQLWLTARALQAGLLRMPDDARALIETVFGDDSELPAGLQRSANQAEGKAYGDAAQAMQNSIKLAKGYAREGLEWAADSVTPSRLGEDSIEVLLGRWEGDTLLPWCQRGSSHDWAYSTVKVAKRLIAEAVPPLSPARQTALQAQLERLPGGGQWVVLLALEPEGGRFTAQARSNRSDGESKVETWSYSDVIGLTKLQTPRAIAPGVAPHTCGEQVPSRPSLGSSP